MAEPRYTYDPITQTYKLIDTPVQQGLGALYEAGANTSGSSTIAAPSVPGPNDARFSMSPFATEVAVNAQNFGQMHKSPTSIVSPVMSAFSAISESAANKALGTQVNPVAAPVAPTETAIAPSQTTALAAMNAQQAAEQNAQQQQAAVANTATSVAQDVADVADTTDAEAGAAAAAAAADAAGVGDTGGNGPGDAGPGGGGPDGDPSSAGDSADDSYFKGGRVMNYAQGGIASLAQKVQSEGRGGDKVLVHMTPKEVAGLQSLAMQHGGSLTINPRTGLVEAGFLSSILPMVAGAALMATPVGAALGAAGTAGLVGGASYLMNPKKGLMGGLMAGLGAYGGANMFSGLAGAEGVGLTGMENEAMKNVYLDPTKIDPTTGQAMMRPEFAAMSQQAQADAIIQAQQQAAKKYAEMGVMDRLSQSASTIASQPITSTVQQLGGPMKVAGMVAPLASAGIGSLAAGEDEGKAPYEAKIRPFTYDPGRKTEEPGFQYRTGRRGESTAEQTYFAPTFTPLGVYKPGEEPVYGTYAGGGITALKHGGMEEGGYVVAADVVSHLGNGSTKAGQKLLKRKLGGVPLNGAGDGMSDSIPTHIEGKQPARVADGEVYIPPGRANPEALDKMMKRIRKAKTGKSRQAPEMNTAKFIPA